MRPIPVLISESTFDRVVQLSTVVLSGVTILLFIASALLVRVSRKTMKHQLRAYVSVKEITFTAILDRTRNITSWQVRVIWQNTGSTPTQNFHNQVFVYILNSIDEHSSDFPSISGSSAQALPIISVAPSSATGGGAGNIAINDLKASQAGLKKIIVRGWGQYGDIFKNKTDAHRTEFCYDVVCDGNPSIIPCNFLYSPHSSHNRTDEEIDSKFTLIDPSN